MQTVLTRKRNQVLTCGYGYIWPLNLHTTGYCLILDAANRSYVWADNRKTLESIANTEGN